MRQKDKLAAVRGERRDTRTRELNRIYELATSAYRSGTYSIGASKLFEEIAQRALSAISGKDIKPFNFTKFYREGGLHDKEDKRQGTAAR